MNKPDETRNEAETPDVSKARLAELTGIISGSEYRCKAYGLAFGMVRNPSDAEDVVQEAFLKAFNAIADFRGDSQLSTWLYRIVYNEALMFLRKERKRTNGGIVQIDHTPIQIPDRQPLQDALAITRNRLELVRNAISALPPRDKNIIERLRVEERSPTVEARLCGLTPIGLRTRLRRAMLRLKECLPGECLPAE